ncbi:MAG: hypothetical protein A2V70_11405 [Planctomycetes bacterium RBG_13_63_9]|nr:MAG: hypothetical protein A2V70_11405 [Planctomycetes bacterium RBG_13_63_9]
MPQSRLYLAGGSWNEDLALPTRLSERDLREDDPPYTPPLARVLHAERPSQRAGPMVRRCARYHGHAFEPLIVRLPPVNLRAFCSRGRRHLKLAPSRIRTDANLLLAFRVAHRDGKQRQRLPGSQLATCTCVEQAQQPDAILVFLQHHAQLTRTQDGPVRRASPLGHLQGLFQPPLGLELLCPCDPPPGLLSIGVVELTELLSSRLDFIADLVSRDRSGPIGRLIGSLSGSQRSRHGRQIDNQIGQQIGQQSGRQNSQPNGQQEKACAVSHGLLLLRTPVSGRQPSHHFYIRFPWCRQLGTPAVAEAACRRHSHPNHRGIPKPTFTQPASCVRLCESSVSTIPATPTHVGGRVFCRLRGS